MINLDDSNTGIKIENSHTVVYGIYANRANAENGVDSLRRDGFLSSDVSVLLTDDTSTKDFAHEKHTKAPEGATTGVGAGAVLGGTLGWLAGIGALAIPGVGPLIAAGPIMAAMAGASVGGAIGGIAGALIGMGIPEYEAKRYEGMVKDGGVLLSVHTQNSDRTKKAKEILLDTGARDISATSEAKGMKASDYSLRNANADQQSPRSHL